MRRVFGAVAVVLLVWSLSMAVPAMAQQPSAVDQYRQSIPSGGGNQPTTPAPSNGDNSGGGGGPSGGSSQPGGVSSSSTTSDGGRHGHGGVGSGAAGLAASTAPHRDSSAGGTLGGPGISPDAGGSKFGDTLSQALGGGDSGGMGIAFPIILGASLIAALFVLFKRRRGGGWQTQ